jgi:hypothetical protein
MRSRARTSLAKIAVVAEEAAEAVYWLEVFVALNLIVESVANPLIAESRELAAIAVASARTARRRKEPTLSEV